MNRSATQLVFRSRGFRLLAVVLALSLLGAAGWTSLDHTDTASAPAPTTEPLLTNDGEHPSLAEADDPGELAPEVSVTVPPGEQPPGQLVQVDPNAVANDIPARQAAYDASVVVRASLEVQVAALDARIKRLDDASRQHVEELSAAQIALQKRVIAAYLRGGQSVDLDDAEAVIDQVAALSVMTALTEDDKAAVARFADAKAKADAGEIAAADQMTEAQSQLTQAKNTEVASKAALDNLTRDVKVKAAGGSVSVRGFLFPVAQPYTYIDSYGFPRSGGRRHQGTDIMADSGTRLFACERGVITKKGFDSMGGNKLWLQGESGTQYYYAHLSRFADVSVGTVVNQGDLIGFVGNTGNASGGLPHLHFEVHPGGGAATNPYPILVAADPKR